MERDIIKIDEELCNGCGLCIPNCQEGALQLIDGKARLVSELMCDGLGACIGFCPEGAIEIERREAEAYNETAVIAEMAGKGKNLVTAHLKHLADHSQEEYLREGLAWLEKNSSTLTFDAGEIISTFTKPKPGTAFTISRMAEQHEDAACGCPGSASRELKQNQEVRKEFSGEIGSELRQWPVQFHLINPSASWFRDADVVLAADCAAFSFGDFHRKFIRNNSVIIACPKLDTGKERYLSKLVQLIDETKINTIRVVMMEVPCCGGLLQLVKQALEYSERKIPVKASIISIQGEILSDSWL
ncbi:MAG: ATP-binding protein [Bacteroidota bacterium]